MREIGINKMERPRRGFFRQFAETYRVYGSNKDINLGELDLLMLSACVRATL